MVQAIANFMKMAYVQWNKDSVTDESIIADLYALSGGQLKLEENVNLNRVEYRANTHTNNNQNNRGGGGGRTNNNQNNRGGGGGGRTNNNNNPRNNNNIKIVIVTREVQKNTNFGGLINRSRPSWAILRTGCYQQTINQKL